MNSYVTVEITGKYVKRFVRSLYKKNIRFYSLDFKLKYVCATISYQDYLKIKELKTIYKVRIINYKGLIKYKQLFSIYKIFIFSIMLGFLLLFVLTNTIFDIDVIHDKKDVRLFIQEQLNLYGIKKFQFVKSFDENEKIASKILTSNRNKLEWLEIERVGCKYIVRVEERKLKQDDDTSNTPRDIVAKKKGMIVSITATKGEVVKKINDYVDIGDVIISGSIKNKDKVKDYVSAKGIVFAEVWYHAQVEVPYLYKEITTTGNTKNILSLKIMNHDFRFFSPFKTKKDNIILSLSNPILPFSISLIHEEETIVEDSIYSEEVAILKALEVARKRLEDTLSDNDTIIYEKHLKNREEDSKIVVDIFFKVKEDITGYMEIVPNVEGDILKE